MKERILLVEDNRSIREILKMSLERIKVRDFEVWGIETQEEARLFFEENKEKLDFVIMDACVPGYNPNTMGLIQHMRKSRDFKGQIIATSGDPFNREILKKAGAHHYVEDKARLTEFFSDLGHA